jgi:hypothetical protein
VAKLFADAGVAALVYTDIARDGMGSGPDLVGAAALAAAVPIPVIASGGVGSLEHVRAAAARAADGARRLRARLVLTRRQGDRVVARRPYAVLLGGESDAPSNVFSGSMLPVQMLFQGQPTVMLKDVGAGLRLKTGRLADGRHRLSLQFNDGVLQPAVPAPRVLVFEFESLLAVAEGETVAIASAVEPVSGETVDVELTIEGAQ